MSDNDVSQRNWFPVIVGGLTIVLAIAFYAKFRPEDFSGFMHRDVDDRSSAELVVNEDGYIAAVKTIFTAYDASKNAGEAYDTLIQLHAPASMKQFHIDCIIALGKLVEGGATNTDDATARFNAIHAQYSWFSL